MIDILAIENTYAISLDNPNLKVFYTQCKLGTTSEQTNTLPFSKVDI